MIQNGNPNQWDKNNWPPEDLVKKDIENEKSYVCVDNDNISMQKLLEKNEFVKCGTIYVGVDKSPRIAFEKTLSECI